jgi:hypothetical protein
MLEDCVGRKSVVLSEEAQQAHNFINYFKPTPSLVTLLERTLLALDTNIDRYLAIIAG